MILFIFSIAKSFIMQSYITLHNETFRNAENEQNHLFLNEI